MKERLLGVPILDTNKCVGARVGLGADQRS